MQLELFGDYVEIPPVITKEMIDGNDDKSGK